MTHEELKRLIKTIKWRSLGGGGFNKVYVSTTEFSIDGVSGYWVVKIPRKFDPPSKMNTKERAVARWRLLNPEYPVHETRDLWITLYLGTTPANDEQVALKIIDIYQREGIIVVDACIKTNFLLHDGKVVCVDVDLALRRGSVISDGFLPRAKTTKEMEDFWDNPTFRDRPLTIAVLRSLIYLEAHLPAESFKKEYLTLPVLKKLDYLRKNNFALTPDILDMLVELVTTDKDNRIPDTFIFSFLGIGSAPAAISGKRHIIHVAAKHGLFAFLKALLAYNPELLDLTDTGGQTPLWWAVEKGHEHVVSLLLSLRANTNLANNDKCTPLDIALAKGNMPIITRLLKADARPYACRDEALSTEWTAATAILRRVSLFKSSPAIADFISSLIARV